MGTGTLAHDDKEYLALDITSESSYSELIEDVEWGYNRNHEQLPQINLCITMGGDEPITNPPDGVCRKS